MNKEDRKLLKLKLLTQLGSSIPMKKWKNILILAYFQYGMKETISSVMVNAENVLMIIRSYDS